MDGGAKPGKEENKEREERGPEENAVFSMVAKLIHNVLNQRLFSSAEVLKQTAEND